jgi:hypothetical protein
MMNCYQTNFNFSADTLNLIKSKYSKAFNKTFGHDTEYRISRNNAEWQPVFRELENFLHNYDIDLKYAGVNAFISNTSSPTQTNPHVDVLHRGKQLLPIKSRFNVMILGNPADPMLWWNNFQFGNPNHVRKTFMYNGHQYESLAIPGDDTESRLAFLGEPSEVKSNILTPSAFVNTSVAHGLQISSGPRLIISVAIDQYIQDYIL